MSDSNENVLVNIADPTSTQSQDALTHIDPASEETHQKYVESLMAATGLSQEQALALHEMSYNTALHASTTSAPSTPPTPSTPRTQHKRRKPVKWEAWEEKNLIEGVRRFGRGNWASIRTHLQFNPCRTNVDLHDKWRVMTGERKRNRFGNRTSAHTAMDPAALPVSTEVNMPSGDAGSADPHDPSKLLALPAGQFFAPLFGGASNQLTPELLASLNSPEFLAMLTASAQGIVEEETVQASGKRKKQKKVKDEAELQEEIEKALNSISEEQPQSPSKKTAGKKKGRPAKAKKEDEDE